MTKNKKDILESNIFGVSRTSDVHHYLVLWACSKKYGYCDTQPGARELEEASKDNTGENAKMLRLVVEKYKFNGKSWR